MAKRNKRQIKNDALRQRNAGYISSISIDKKNNKKTNFSLDDEEDNNAQVNVDEQLQHKEELMEDILDSLEVKQKKENEQSDDDDDEDDDDDDKSIESSDSSVVEEIPSSISREQAMNQLKAEKVAASALYSSKKKKNKSNKIEDDDDDLSDDFLRQVDEEKKISKSNTKNKNALLQEKEKIISYTVPTQNKSIPIKDNDNKSNINIFVLNSNNDDDLLLTTTITTIGEKKKLLFSRDLEPCKRSKKMKFKKIIGKASPFF